MNMAFYYVEHAEQILLGSALIPRDRPKAAASLSAKEQWSLAIKRDLLVNLGQILATGSLALAVYFLIGAQAKDNVDAICAARELAL
jgi:hypothetical protein